MDLSSALARLAEVVVPPDMPLSDATHRLDAAGTGCLLVSGNGVTLEGVLTDGDIRRSFLRGVSFSEPCLKSATRHPVTASPDLPWTELAALLAEYDVNHLPLVGSDGAMKGLLLRRDFMTPDTDVPTAVIMAGGFGRRLMPLTSNTPKPMLEVGGRPLMEITVERLRRAGIREVSITTHYLAEMIENHFGDGESFGVHMSYMREDQPLGTGGGLRHLNGVTGPLLVVNGDVLTGVDFNWFLSFHRENRADVTVGVRQHEMQIPYGVVECDGPYIRSLREKPVTSCLVNAGIYIVEQRALRFAPDRQQFDMTELIQRLLDSGRRVVAFPIMEYWIDIGQHGDYAKAKEAVNGKL